MELESVIHRYFYFTVLAEYKFGIASLTNKKELLQVGDPVQFQVHQVPML
jgi:hypothetical protein